MLFDVGFFFNIFSGKLLLFCLAKWNVYSVEMLTVLVYENCGLKYVTIACYYISKCKNYVSVFAGGGGGKMEATYFAALDYFYLLNNV